MIPFSLTLETNASATGHVTIKSRGVTNEAVHLTVKAASQSNIANVKEVTLFYIQVSNVVEPTLKPVLLKTDVLSDHHISMIPGKNLEVNFTVKNLASAESYSFNVSSYVFRCHFTCLSVRD